MTVNFSDPPARPHRISLFRFGIYASFFLSGLTSLLFEVLWSRQFVTVFGNSNYAISIVLCAYMAGIGLGGLLGGRLADRLSRRTFAFAIIQAVIAFYALTIPSMLDWMRLFVPALSVVIVSFAVNQHHRSLWFIFCCPHNSLFSHGYNIASARPGGYGFRQNYRFSYRPSLLRKYPRGGAGLPGRGVLAHRHLWSASD